MRLNIFTVILKYILCFLLLWSIPLVEIIALEDPPPNYTDEEKNITETYIHKGYTKRSYDEQCRSQEICSGEDVDTTFLGIQGSLIKALSKAYSLVLGSGVTGDLVMKTNEKVKGAVEKKEESDSSDYCQYIAAGTEAVSLVQLTIKQGQLNDLPVNQGTVEKDQLYKAAAAHGDRADVAIVQTTGWGLTAACYAAMMARPSVDPTAWQNLLKLGAAGMLSAFYYTQWKAYSEHEEDTLKIADQMPGKGDCNPISQVECYCLQPETQDDPEYCSQKIAELNTPKPPTPLCIDQDLNADPVCECKRTNTCYDQIFDKKTMHLKLGHIFQNEVGQPFKKLTRGELKYSSVKGGVDQFLAIAHKNLNKFKPKKNKDRHRLLTDEEKKEVLSISQLNIPKWYAKALATVPYKGEMKDAIKQFHGGISIIKKNDRKKRRKQRILRFTGGHSLQTHKTRRKKPSLKKRIYKKKRSSNSKVSIFAEMALEQAKRKEKERDLFQIISYRYQKIQSFK